MQDILISTPTVNSVVHCGAGALDMFAPSLAGKSLFIITDSNVAALYVQTIKNKFGSSPVYVIPAGEKSKNPTRLLDILKRMIECGVTRSSTVIAFGGGVVGDIAGLAASLYMRGVNVVQIPTTLLSQVDSSVGGKTAVDMYGVKNIIGSFYQPSQVIVDSNFLATLPPREIRCGLGEIIKYGALDADIYTTIQNNRDNLFDLKFLDGVIPACINHKAKVVTQDEKDTSGVRKSLNLGHTTGHAFELFYKRKSHGEFVLIGAYYELFIAECMGVCGGEYANALRSLIKKVIKNIPAYDDADKAAQMAKYDKKNEGQFTISMVVPKSLGAWQEIKLPISEYVKLISKCSAQIKGEK